jgi:hypothetical protein
MWKNSFIGIGVGIGMLIGVPLYFFVVNNLFYKGNPAKNVIPVYMKNSQTLEVLIPDRDPQDPNSLMTYKDTLYVSKLQKNGDGDLFKIKFYSSEYKKYFLIRLFDPSPTFRLPDVLINKKVVMTVNNDDLNNPLYGSKENPVPVFKYNGTPPIEFGGNIYGVTQQEYLYNVTQYLTYLMPKKDFQKRFGKE